MRKNPGKIKKVMKEYKGLPGVAVWRSEVLPMFCGHVPTRDPLLHQLSGSLDSHSLCSHRLQSDRHRQILVLCVHGTQVASRVATGDADPTLRGMLSVGGGQ